MERKGLQEHDRLHRQTISRTVVHGDTLTKTTIMKQEALQQAGEDSDKVVADSAAIEVVDSARKECATSDIFAQKPSKTVVNTN